MRSLLAFAVVGFCSMIAASAQVTGAGTSTLVIDGVRSLAPAQHRVVGDRVAAGTFAFAAAITGGDVLVAGVDPRHLSIVLDTLRAAGADVLAEPSAVRVIGRGQPRAVDVATLPYPGFPTDLQPFALVLDAVATGSALVTENMFEARFHTAHELARLGADIRVDGHHALVRGRTRLSAAPVVGSDIRAAAALVLAGLVADGVTSVEGASHVRRGYADFAGDLRRLGAEVVEVSDGLP